MRTGLMLLAVSAGMVGSAVNPSDEPPKIQLAIPVAQGQQLAMAPSEPSFLPSAETIVKLEAKCDLLETKLADNEKKLSEQGKAIAALTDRLKTLEATCKACQQQAATCPPASTSVVSQPTAVPVGNSTVIYPQSYQPQFMPSAYPQVPLHQPVFQQYQPMMQSTCQPGMPCWRGN